jgi:phage terminase small subunit
MTTRKKKTTKKRTTTRKKKPTTIKIKSSGRTDRKQKHPIFTAAEITDENIQLFLKVITEQHRVFAMEYTRTWNARAAYQKLHPHSKYNSAKVLGIRMLQNKNVQLYLDYLAKKKNERYEITKDQIMKDLDTVKRQAMNAVPAFDKDGEFTGEFRFDGSVANKSIELQGKEIGMFVNKVQITDTKSHHFMYDEYVVPQIKPIDMADPNYQLDIKQAVEQILIERAKNK